MATGDARRPAGREELVLARDGRAGYVIALAADASPPERRAAHELAAFLAQATGAKFGLTTPGAAGGMPCIAVGAGAARAIVRGVSLDGLGPDGIVIRASPPHLAISGGPGAPRGTLYAVYTFLEDRVGFRWWTPKATLVPRRPTLAVPASLDVRYVPPFERRDQCFKEGFDADWAVRMKYNGWTGPGEDESRGGVLSYAGPMVHTFYALAPPKEHFAAHPEWYSERDGRRFHEGGQLCLANAELLELVVRQARSWLAKSPRAAFVSVSQNDWDGHCLCAKCRAIEEEEGSPAGPLLRFVNAVAERLEPEFPNVAVDTLAYQYTRRPPRLTRPRPNVIVRLCSIECSFAHPLEHEKNRAFREDVEGWARICGRLYVWDYVTDFSHYIQPHPNLRVLGPNVRFFARNNVKGLFEQGNYTSLGGEFGALRAWVLGKLLWDPGLDDRALLDEFLRGYYGAAAPFLKQYIDLVHDAAARSDHYTGCFSGTTAPFLSFDVMNRAEALFQEAERAVEKDPENLGRVRVAHLPVRYVAIVRWPQFRLASARAGGSWAFPASRVEAIAEFEDVCRQSGIEHLAESGRPVASLRNDFGDGRREVASPPPGGFALAPGRWIDLQDDLFGLYQRGKLSDLRADARASDGMAAWMPLAHREWAVQLRLDAPELALEGEWTAYVVARVEGRRGEGLAFTCGIWDTEKKRSVAEIAVQARGIADEGYRSYEIGAFSPRPSMYLWVAPPGAPGELAGSLWVDRFFLVRRR